LEIILAGHAIAARLRIARELDVLLGHVERCAANLYVAAVALVGPGQWVRTAALAVPATHPVLVVVVLLSLPHTKALPINPNGFTRPRSRPRGIAGASGLTTASSSGCPASLASDDDSPSQGFPKAGSRK